MVDKTYFAWVMLLALLTIHCYQIDLLRQGIGEQLVKLRVVNAKNTNVPAPHTNSPYFYLARSMFYDLNHSQCFLDPRKNFGHRCWVSGYYN